MRIRIASDELSRSVAESFLTDLSDLLANNVLGSGNTIKMSLSAPLAFELSMWRINFDVEFIKVFSKDLSKAESSV